VKEKILTSAVCFSLYSGAFHWQARAGIGWAVMSLYDTDCSGANYTGFSNG
jgi:hypothetical protein